MGNGFKDKNGKFRPTKKKNGGVSLEEMYAKQVNKIIKNFYDIKNHL